MSFGHFPPDYGQGTGLAAGHTALGAELNQMIANGHPSVKLARRMVGKKIFVDPVNGDDHPANDGTSTPLRSLEAMADRLPVRAKGGGSIADRYKDLDSVVIELAAGDYVVEREQGFDIELHEHMMIRGNGWRVRETFELDSYANDNLEVHKSAATPAWTPGEFKEMFLQYSFDFGPYGIYSYRLPILDNGDHWLLMAWSPSPWGNEPSQIPGIGDEVSIVEPGARIDLNGKPARIRARNGILHGLDFFNGVSIGVDVASSSVFSSRFSNITYPLIGQISNFNVAHSIFRDASYGIYADGGAVIMRAALFARCSIGVRPNLRSRLYVYGAPMFKDCTTGILATSGGVVDYGSAGVYCDGTPTFFSGGPDAIFNMSGNLAAMDGKVPATLFNVKNNSTIGVHPSTAIEASGNTFLVNGVASTMANFLGAGGHNGWWTDTNGNRVYKRT